MAKDKSEKDKVEDIRDTEDDISVEEVFEEKDEVVQEEPKDVDISISGADAIAGRV